MNIINDAIEVILKKYELKINEDDKVIGEDAEEARIIENFIKKLRQLIFENIQEDAFIWNNEFTISLGNDITEKCELSKKFTWCENDNVFETFSGSFYYNEFPVAYEFTFCYYSNPNSLDCELSGVVFNYMIPGKRKCYRAKRITEE